MKGHYMNTVQLPSIVIMSAEVKGLSPFQNSYRTEQMAMWLGEVGLAWKAVEGVWNGTKEMSFVVTYRTDEELGQLIDLAKLYDQEAILYADQERNAYLLRQVGPSSVDSIGKLVTKAGRLPDPEPTAYTRELDGSLYYVVE